MSKSNPFDLPPPWNPGYCLPQNVDDEGLQRHTYTTAWAPRGSYDDPKVGYAGYAVPDYVEEEGYGQGAFTTRWAARGTYSGPRVPHWLDKQTSKITGATRLPGGAAKLQIQTMAGIESAATGGHAPFTAYGLNAAKALLETVKMMPPDVRVKQLKLALNKIDPKLYSRAEEEANKETKTGVPADVALERGLAVAMSRGIATELVDLGKGKKPPRKSQLGAVMLGALPIKTVSLTTSPFLATLLPIKTIVPATTTTALPQAGQCNPNDSRLIWAIGSTGTGYWRTRKVGEECAGTAVLQPPTVIKQGTCSPDGSQIYKYAGGQWVTTASGPVWKEGPGSWVPRTSSDVCYDASARAPGGVTVTDSSGNVVTSTVRPPPSTPPSPEAQKFLNIGPFMIPIAVGAWRDHRPLPAEQKAYVDQNLAIAAKAGGTTIAEMKTGKYPFIRFKGPNDEPWGLFYSEEDGTRKSSRGTLIPAGTVVAYHKIAPSMLGNILGDAWGGIKDAAEWVGGAIASVFKKIWAGIKWVAAKVVDFVKDAVEWVKDKACDLFTSPVGQIAGAAAGAYVGGPAGAQMGAQGAQMIAQACTGPQAPAETPPPAAPEKSNLMPILLIGGAGIAAYLLLGGKKKAHHGR